MKDRRVVLQIILIVLLAIDIYLKVTQKTSPVEPPTINIEIRDKQNTD